VSEPYFIEVDNNGCSKCSHGRNWCVVGPDGAAGGTSYGDEEDAAAIAEILNDAFSRGAHDPTEKLDLLKSQRHASIVTEGKDATRIFEALVGAGYPTPLEGYGNNSSWAISDLIRAFKQFCPPKPLPAPEVQA
jgi:hypothetical protein